MPHIKFSNKSKKLLYPYHICYSALNATDYAGSNKVSASSL